MFPAQGNNTGDGDFESVTTDEGNIDTHLGNLRFSAIKKFNEIWNHAGVPAGSPLGPRPNKTVGLSDEAALTAESRIQIDNEGDGSGTDIAVIADSGSGTKADPYVIRDRDLDNSEGTTNDYGIYWTDPDADYYVKLKNCRVHGYPTGQIGGDWGSNNVGANAGEHVRLTIENCKIWSTTSNDNGIGANGGHLTVDRSHIAGVKDRVFSANAKNAELNVIDTRIDEAKTSYDASDCFALFDTPDITIRYVEVTGPSGMSRGIRTNRERKTFDVIGLHIHDLAYNAAIDDAGGDWAGSRFRRSKFANSGGNNELVKLKGQRDVRFEECEFIDAPDGQRAFFATSDGNGNPCDDVVCYRCLGRDTNGTGGAGNEVFESWESMNVRFEECFVHDCSEDAYEHAYPVGGCEVVNCAGIGVSGQMVDFFKSSDGTGTTTIDRNVGCWYEGIYGKAGGGVIVTDLKNVDGRDIFVECTSGDALKYNQKDSTTTPDNCRHYGSLPKPSVVSGSLVVDDTGKNEVVYFADGSITDENNNAPSDRTTVR